jgi:hypothetical protein
MGEKQEGLMSQVSNALDMAKKIQQNSGDCMVCHAMILPGQNYLMISDTDLGVGKLCIDCQFKAGVAYVKKYKKSLQGDEVEKNGN